MEGSSSSSGMKSAPGLPPIAPPYNSSTGGQGALIPNSGSSDVITDAVAKRRAQSREYSKRYRQKKQNEVTLLEYRCNILRDQVSEDSQKLEFYCELKERLGAENTSLMEEFSQVNAILEAKNAEIDMLLNKREMLKLEHAQQLEILRYQGK